MKEQEIVKIQTLNLHNHEHTWLIRELDANNVQSITKSRIEVN
jgi:hypothetical protein